MEYRWRRKIYAHFCEFKIFVSPYAELNPEYDSQKMHIWGFSKTAMIFNFNVNNCSLITDHYSYLLFAPKLTKDFFYFALWISLQLH